MKTLTDVVTMLFKAVKLAAHPVGSIYMSTVSTSPATLFGGTWVQITDRFLWCAGTSHAAGTTGGEETHKLTIAEMPKHTHKVAIFTGGSSDAGSYTTRWFSNDGSSYTNSTENAKIYHIWKSGTNLTYGSNNGVSGTGDPAGNALAQGSSDTHNNMPPYLAVYAWKRTA